MTLREQVLAVLKIEGWKVTDFADRCPGLSKSCCEFLVSGRRGATEFSRAPVEDFLRRHARGEFDDAAPEVVTIDSARQRRRGGQKAPVRAHYETAFYRRVAKTLAYTADHSRLSLITSEYGNGKTHAALRWRSETLTAYDSFVMTFRGVLRHDKQGFLEALAGALGLSVSVRSAPRFRDVYYQVVDRLQRAPLLMVFDQCEAVRTRILQIIRDLHDETRDAGVGVALLASPLLYERLWRSRGADIGALTSRVEHFPIPGVELDELAGIVAAEGWQCDQDALRAWHAATQGSMRVLLHTLDLLGSGHRGKPVTPKVIEGVCRHLIGGRVVTEPARGAQRVAASGERRAQA